LDSHADTSVVGDATALIIQNFDEHVRVFGCDGSKSIEYVNPETEDSFMLVIHQAILVPKMTANLMESMQLQESWFLTNDELKLMVQKPTEEQHCIKISGSEDKGQLNIPLPIKGWFPYFPTWKPTLEEYKETPDDIVM